MISSSSTNSYFGPVINPLSPGLSNNNNKLLSAGGSSGGSAVAVASNMAFM